MFSMATKRQSEVLAFIRTFARAHSVGPTVREIQKHFQFASSNAVQCHLTALRKKGYLAERGRVWRGAQPVEGDAAIPVYGTIPAGLPVDAVAEADETLGLDESLLGLPAGSRVFALRVRGRSMIGAGINDGDLVFLVDRPARHRDIVAALIDGESTLKRYIDRPRGAVLQAENPEFDDLHPVRELTIQGVMVGLFRRGAG